MIRFVTVSGHRNQLELCLRAWWVEAFPCIFLPCIFHFLEAGEPSIKFQFADI
jgi:hypothetical protein